MGVFNFANGQAGDRTKKFDWKGLFAHHPVFACLGETETAVLLGAGASQERTFAAGTEVVRQGEPGDSCFVVGAGSLRVEMEAPGGRRVTLTTLRKGDVFGEIAVLDRRVRSASVTAAQDSVLLEIEGEVLRELVVGHPDLELSLLVSLTDKLRTTNDRLLSLNLRDSDEALKLFDAKLSAEVRVFDAALKAAQVVFEQTKVRADEVIASAERNRSRTTTLASLGGTLLTLLSLFGVKQVVDLKNLADQVPASLDEARSTLKEVEALKVRADVALEDLKRADEGAARARKTLIDTQLVPVISSALGRGVESDAIEGFNTLVDVAAFEKDTLLLPRLLNEAEFAIAATGSPEPAAKPRTNPNFTTLLRRLLEQSQEPKSRAQAFILLLANAALASCGGPVIDTRNDARENWETVLAQFESFAREHRGQALLSGDELQKFEPRLRQTCPAKLEPLQRVVALVRA